MVERRQVELVRARKLSPDVRQLGLSCVDDRPFAFLAGQWVNLEVPVDGQTLTRAYSLCSAPDLERPAQIEIAVTRVRGGPASCVLHELPLGKRLEIHGPHGFFTREPAPEGSALFIGTGTGLAPLRAMLQQELARDGVDDLALLFGCRSEQDVLWENQLRQWAEKHSRFCYEVTLSQAGSNWKGRAGYVQHHLADVLAPLGRPHVYVCGLSRMVTEVRRILKNQLGYERRWIHTERYD
ncbi:MAG: FAD-dependent oxidoreductase [Proteobacteria bacterium]|nr:FAD-dependent oxidoreductase [Pseudomonadota bacterium]